VTQAADAIRQVLVSFSGLPNRLEFVREFDGVRYYNDSFASDPYATEAAIDAIPGTKVMIVGGFERMLPLEQFAQTIKSSGDDIRTLILIGASAKRVAAALHSAGFDKFKLSPAKNMREIVAEAHAHAVSGDAVLLSPGFASFDMFKNFEDRGLQFKEAVHNL
jgi:UDP-N-acetylmuramoylalanine--D-glutamate ligase